MQLLNPHGTATRQDLVTLFNFIFKLFKLWLFPRQRPDEQDLETFNRKLILELNHDQRSSGSLNEVQGIDNRDASGND